MSREQAKILVVSAGEAQSESLNELLATMRYSCDVATGVEQGLEKISDFDPDVVFAYHQLPDGTGIDLISRFKVTQLFSSVIFILIAAEGEVDQVEALSLGAHEVIRDKENVTEILVRMGNLLIERKLKQQIEELNKELEKEREQIENEKLLLERFFSADLVGSILRGEQSTQIGGDLVDATALVFDLRGSTPLAEALGPDRFSSFLSDFFGDISNLVFANQGSINNFRGDGFLITFGIPQQDGNHAQQAGQTAVKIREYVEEYNRDRPDFVKDEISIAIGIATGPIYAGNIGSKQRQEFTLLGSTIDLVNELETLTKAAKVDILIDGSTKDALGDECSVKKVIFKNRPSLESKDIYYLHKL